MPMLPRPKALPCAAGFVAASWFAAAAAWGATLEGSAFWGDLEPLPREAVFEAQLVDTQSARDAPAKVVGSVRIDRPASGIVSFAIDYDSADVVPARRYAISARIVVDGRALYTGELQPVAFGSSAADPAFVLLRLVRVAAAPAPAPQAPPPPRVEEDL